MNDTIRVGSEQLGDDRFASLFEVEKMEGDFTRIITTIKEEKFSRIINGVEKLQTIRKLERHPESFSVGYMIYYPQGHSVFVAADDKAQLMQLGVISSEDEEPDTRPMRLMPGIVSAKEAVQKAEGRKRRSSVGGIEEAMRG